MRLWGHEAWGHEAWGHEAWGIDQPHWRRRLTGNLAMRTRTAWLTLGVISLQLNRANPEAAENRRVQLINVGPGR